MIDFKNAEYLKLAPSSIEKAQDTVGDLLVPGERIEAAFKAVRDSVVFTNKRVIAVNVQGITGRKVDYTSLPYSKVQAFSAETAGTFDLDSELTLWYSALGKIRFEFVRGADMSAMSRFIAQAVL